MLQRMIVLAGAAALAAGLAVSCATNPVTGRRELSLVSANQELAIGREGHGAIVGEYGRYDDAALQAYVDSLGQALAKVSHRPDMAWTFTVLDDPVVNAFAVPGGYVYITRGILSHFDSEAQLAGVLGHEIGHVTARHGAQQMTQQQLLGAGLALGTLFSETVRQYSREAQTALGLLTLKYGRDDENEADGLGVRYSTAAGWDPRQIPRTYEMLKRVGDRSGQRLPAFLSTHPDPGDRMQRTTALAAEAAAGKSGLLVRQRDYLRRIDGVVYGPDPRQGFFEGARYSHPGMRLEITFPSGWKTQDTKSAVVAALEQKGQMQMTLADAGTLTPAAFVRGLLDRQRISDARGAEESIGGWPAWVGRIVVPDGQGGATTLVAAWVRQAPDRMIQIVGVGATATEQSAITAAARSMRPLTDPGRLGVRPDRLKVVSAPANGTLASVLPRLGTQTLSPEEASVLNNLDLDAEVRTGELLKIVVAGRAR